MKVFLKRIALLVLILGAGYFLRLPNAQPMTNLIGPPQSSSQPQVKAAIDVKNVPEMVEILGPDQEKRLLAGRKLVERVGVEDALEILEYSTLPHTGEGHLVVHQIGFHAYRTFGIEAILHCKDYFLFACYHGAIIEAAGDQGLTAITDMTDTCKQSSVRYFQCVHAAGHAILAMFNYDLQKAMTTCDDLYEKETRFPDALSSCHNGAFMENLFGVHDWGSGKEPVRDWLRDDEPYFPCTAFGEKYQRGCWLNQAARIYQMYQGDIEKTAKTCEEAGNRQYTEWCFDNLARQIHPLTNGDTSQVIPLCSKLGTYWSEGCIIVNAGAYYSVGGRKESLDVCGQLAEPAKGVCFGKLVGQIVGDTLTLPEKKDWCDKLPIPFADTCGKQLQTAT